MLINLYLKQVSWKLKHNELRTQKTKNNTSKKGTENRTECIVHAIKKSLYTPKS